MGDAPETTEPMPPTTSAMPIARGSVPPDDLQLAHRLRSAYELLQTQLQQVIIGQQEVIQQVLLALFCQGHCILEGVPGLAKTLLVSSLAKLLSLDFKRIQFTPDLMPADITGTELLEEEAETGRRHLKFVPGPIFTNLLLADELNRTPPKTQSALLQAMQEYRVTAAGVDYPLEQPFLVLGTQNPIEQEGTYQLPEAQLDRFLFKIYIYYPSFADEVQMALATTAGARPNLTPVLQQAEILELQALVRRVLVGESLAQFAVRLVRASRTDDPEAPAFARHYVRWGAGPRASQALLLAGKAYALLHGRYHVAVEDVCAIAKPVLRHRILLNYHAEADGLQADTFIDRLLQHALARHSQAMLRS